MVTYLRENSGKHRNRDLNPPNLAPHLCCFVLCIHPSSPAAPGRMMLYKARFPKKLEN